MTGAFSIGSAAPNIQAFSAARGAAAAIFNIIDQVRIFVFVKPATVLTAIFFPILFVLVIIERCMNSENLPQQITTL